MHKNFLTVVGITILFLGLAIQPSIAVNPISSDNEDDCDICSKVSKLQLVENYQKLFDKLTTLKEMNKEYVSGLFWNFPISCGILKIIVNLFVNISHALENLPRTPWVITLITTYIAFIADILGSVIGCWDFSWDPFPDY